MITLLNQPWIERLGEIVVGKVAMVHPEAANGAITVDVAIDDALPPGVDVQEPVDGVVTTGR